MKYRFIKTFILLVFLAGCKSNDGASSTPSLTNPETPCDIDCDDSTNPDETKITYIDTVGSNGSVWTYSDNWEHSWDKSEITKGSSYVALADGAFELSNRNNDRYDIGAAIKVPYCNDSSTRVFIVFTDSLEADSSVRVISITLNTVSIYNVVFNVSSPSIQGSIDYQLLESEEYSCENGLLIRDNGVIGANDKAILGRTPDEVNQVVDAWSLIGFHESLLTNSMDDFENGNNFTQVIYRNQFEDLASAKFMSFNQATTYLFGYDSDSNLRADYKYQRTISGSTTATTFLLSEGIIPRAIVFGLQPDKMVDKDNAVLSRAIFGYHGTNIKTTQGNIFWAID